MNFVSDLKSTHNVHHILNDIFTISKHYNGSCVSTPIITYIDTGTGSGIGDGIVGSFILEDFHLKILEDYIVTGYSDDINFANNEISSITFRLVLWLDESCSYDWILGTARCYAYKAYIDTLLSILKAWIIDQDHDIAFHSQVEIIHL
jgi:hypothetical protein